MSIPDERLFQKRIVRTKLLHGVLYDNAVRPALCEGWHFTHMMVSLPDRNISLREDV